MVDAEGAGHRVAGWTRIGAGGNGLTGAPSVSSAVLE